MAPKGLPVAARPMPMPAAMMRKTPQKKASPTPDRGPMRDALTAWMLLTSKFSSSAASRSMAAQMPETTGCTFRVMLYQEV